MTGLSPPSHAESSTAQDREPSAVSRPGSSIGARLARFLYPAPAKRSVGAIFKWWERRRLGFNLIVGAGGTISVVPHGMLTWFQGPNDPFLLPVVFWLLVGANVCYTLGPLTESILHKFWGRDVLPVGPHLLRAGLALSVGVTFVLPMLALGVRLAVAFLSAIFG